MPLRIRQLNAVQKHERSELGGVHKLCGSSTLDEEYTILTGDGSDNLCLREDNSLVCNIVGNHDRTDGHREVNNLECSCT